MLTDSGGGGDGGDAMIWVYETWGLTSFVSPMYSYTDEADLHTRVMVRDTNAGYHTTNTSISTRAVFTDVDSDVFLTRFAREYPNYSTNNNYATGLASRNDDVGNTVIVVNTSGGDSVELGRGWVTDSDFVSLMAAWGITINMAPNYGTVVYYTDDTYTTTNSLVITELETVAELSASFTDNWTAQVAGIEVEGSKIKEVRLTNLVNTLPSYFLRGCKHLETVDISSTQVTTIPTMFMRNCTNYSGTMVLPQTVKTIESYFMAGCESFNSPLVLPSSLTSISGSFLTDCFSMTSFVHVGSLAATIATTNTFTFSMSKTSCPAYTTGITIRGSTRSAWMSRFANRTSYPYRKLIDGGA